MKNHSSMENLRLIVTFTGHQFWPNTVSIGGRDWKSALALP